MSKFYRGHEIVMLEGSPKIALIVERRSGVPLPTKITALPQEEEHSYLDRARQLIDLYLEPAPARLSANAQFRT